MVASASTLSRIAFGIEQRDHSHPFIPYVKCMGMPSSTCVCCVYYAVQCICARPLESKLVYGFPMPASKRLLCRCSVGSSGNWPRIYSQLLVCRHNTQYYIISTFSVISSTVKTIMQLLSVLYIDETDDEEVRERRRSRAKE